MKKILLIGTLLLAVVVAVYRQRIYLWDFLGKVERNGVRVEGARVFINYSNDVLVKEGGSFSLVQGWNRVPGAPKHLSCLRSMVCWTEADRAESVAVAGAAGVEMSSKSVSFTDAGGARVQVRLR